ncbi:hypothetical protein HGA91_03775 [candidate division WWE3 bacterium]|nr:hypothetical protein [candidate division WWE3 bacterium]
MPRPIQGVLNTLRSRIDQADQALIAGLTEATLTTAHMYERWFGPGVIWIDPRTKETVFRTWWELAQCRLKVGNLPQGYQVGRETLYMVRHWWGGVSLYRVANQ